MTSIAEYWKDPEWRAKHKARMSKVMLDKWNDPIWAMRQRQLMTKKKTAKASGRRVLKGKSWGISVSFAPDEFEIVKAYAIQNKTSMSEVIRIFVTDALEQFCQEEPL